jgi:hypothetical protein
LLQEDYKTRLKEKKAIFRKLAVTSIEEKIASESLPKLIDYTIAKKANELIEEQELN